MVKKKCLLWKGLFFHEDQEALFVIDNEPSTWPPRTSHLENLVFKTSQGELKDRSPISEYSVPVTGNASVLLAIHVFVALPIIMVVNKELIYAYNSQSALLYILFDLHNICIRQVLLLALFYKWQNWG